MSKKKNKFLVGGMATAVIASAIVPVAASAEEINSIESLENEVVIDFNLADVENPFVDVSENSSHLEGILFGYKNGILTGYEDKFNPNESIKRVHAALMVARALGAKTDGNYADAGFKDVPEDYKWAVNFLVEKGIVNGVSKTTFGSNNFTTRGQMAKILVNAFDLSSEDSLAYLDNIGAESVQFEDTVNNQFEDYIETLSQTSVTIGTGDGKYAPKDNVTRAQFATFIHRSFGYNKDVKDYIQAVKEQEAAEEAAKIVELDVENVSALNSKDIEFKFNVEVKSDTIKPENFEVKVGNKLVSSDNYTVSLSSDEKTATIVLKDKVKLSEGVGVELSVSDKILSKEFNKGLEETFTKTIVFSDKIAPQLVNIEAEGGNVILTFDEYVSSADIIKIGGTNVNIPAPTAGESLKTIKLVGALSEFRTGSYEIVVAGVTDLLGNKSKVFNGTVTVHADVAAPKVASVEQYDNNTVKVKFDKSVSFLSNGGIKIQRNGFDLSTSVTKINDKEYLVSAVDVGSLTVYDNKAKTTTLKVIAEGFRSINTGEIGLRTEQIITLTRDEFGPFVKTYSNKVVNKGVYPAVNEVFSIEFDEDITITGTNNDIFVTDKDGVRHDVTNASVYTDVYGNKNTLELSVASLQKPNGELKAGVYNIYIVEKYVSDKHGNKSPKTRFSFEVKASSEKGVTGVIATSSATSDTITLSFSEEMGSQASNILNYAIDGKVIPADSVFYLSPDKKTLTIKLPAETIRFTGGAVVSISDRVLTATGKSVDKAYRTLIIESGLVDNTSPTLLSANKKSVNTIELVFSENIEDLTLDAGNKDFKVLVNGFEYAYSVSTGTNIGDNKVLLTTSDDFTLGSNITVEVTDIKDNISITDTSGNKLKANGLIVSN